MIHFRPGTGDERILAEVLERRCYRRAKIGFDVAPGERWLDLGANIGAFALYCKRRDAVAECYEPDPDCFELLKQNVPEFECYRTAVTAANTSQLNFYVSSDAANHSRGTVSELPRYRYKAAVPNYTARAFRTKYFDGVKMDIEGSEGPILDNWLLPSCKKLVLEYHTSRDSSIERLTYRLYQLKSRFRTVAYPPEYDRAIKSGAKEFKSFFDRNIFCMDPL